MQISRDILFINRFLRQGRESYMASFGLRSIHALILLELGQAPGISQEQLSQRLGFEKSIVARHAATLEELGYLRRDSHSRDKRALQLFPTQTALEMLPGLQQAMEAQEQQLLGALSPEQTQLLEPILRALRSQCQEV